MKCLAIEGLDGSGKTTVAQALKAEYLSEGINAGVVAPYRLAAKLNGGDLYPLWRIELGAQKAIHVLKRVLASCTQQAEKRGLDVLIFDRHWMTAFTEIGDNQKLVTEWGYDFVQTAYLEVDPGIAFERSSSDRFEAWMSPEGLNSYAERYKNLCRSYGQHILGIYRNDGDISPEAIARSIVWDVNILR